jgi:hypothetical protein
MGPEIFISYKREDASHAVALRIKDFVEQSLAYRVIWDENGLDTGDDIRAYMDRLAQGTYIIFVLSPAFMESPYCMYELARAGSLDHFKKRAFGVVLLGTSLDHDGISGVIDHWIGKWEAFKGKVEGWQQKNPRLVTLELQSKLKVLEEISVHSSSALFGLADKKWLAVDPAGHFDEEELWGFVQRWTQPVPPKATPPPATTPIEASQQSPKIESSKTEPPKAQPVKPPPAKVQAGLYLDPALQQLIDDMVHVKGGTFHMGSSDGQDNERPVHAVTLRDYSICRYPLTQAQWQAVDGFNPSAHKGNPRLPVEQVSWQQCQAFINQLNALTKRRFRLPTEAEWEYAARGGQLSKGYRFAGSNDVDQVAWHGGNAGGKTHPVGAKFGNELDLHDMSGNVWEWCQDRYAERYDGHRASALVLTPSLVTESFERKVARGGSKRLAAGQCRVAFRNSFRPDDRFEDVGFRLVMEV